MLVSALVIALTLGFTSAASAQTPFQANGTFTPIRPTALQPGGPCSNGAYICGTANVAGYGAATWNVFVIDFTSVPSACGSSYAAVTDFTLVSDPNSTLVLDESGSLCGLGADGAAYRGYFVQGSQSFGKPFSFVGNWTIDPSSTGEFAGLDGSGTDAINVAGAHLAGSYRGTLG